MRWSWFCLGWVMVALGVIGALLPVMPTTIFLKPNGTVHRKWTGFLTEEKLDQLIDELLGRS